MKDDNHPPRSYLHNKFLGAGVPGFEHVVQWPLDHVVHHVQLPRLDVTILEDAQTPQQQVGGGRQRKPELDMVASCVSKG